MSENNASGGPQVLQIRQTNGINIQNSIKELQQKRSIQARFIDGEFSQSSKLTFSHITP